MRSLIERRAFLRGAAAAPFAVPALALDQSDDPAIAAAIREFEAASHAYLEAPERDEIRAPFFEIRAAKLQALGEIMPSTRAGALQLLSAVYEEEEPYLDAKSPLHGVICNLIAFLEGANA